MLNKAVSYYRYIKNGIYLLGKKVGLGRNLRFAWKQLIGPQSSVVIAKNADLTIGEKLYTRSGFHLFVESGECIIGDHCFFNHNCSITCLKKITIGNRCTFGNNLVIVDHDHNFKDNKENEFLCSEVSIGDNTWIGASVIILRGSRIGENCVIGAGAVVNGTIPDKTIYISKRIVEIKTI